MSGFWGGRPSEGGQAVILVAVTMTAMLMILGLAIDAGQLYVARRTMQEAADAAAYAGAVVIYQGGTTAQAAAAAVADAQRNGYANGAGSVTVTVNIPPASGPHASPAPGDPRYVEVIVTDQIRTSLLVGQSQLSALRVRGVAGAEPLNNGYAIMALDRGNTSNALNVQPGGVVNVSGAGILVNSTAASAANNQGGAISVTPAPPYGTTVAGNMLGAWPNPTTGAPQGPDPFAGYPKPSTAGVPVYSALPGGNPIVLNPGIYTVPIEAAGGTTIQLNTGIYITKKGINGAGNADIVSNAGGVLIFNTTMDYPNGSSGGCQSVRLTGNASSSLAPMTTGTYAGLLLYQDPACTADFVIAGNGTLTATGTIYVPNAKFVMNGSNATLTGSQLVAKTLDIQNGNITISFSAGSTAQPVLPRLAE